MALVLATVLFICRSCGLVYGLNGLFSAAWTTGHEKFTCTCVSVFSQLAPLGQLVLILDNNAIPREENRYSKA